MSAILHGNTADGAGDSHSHHPPARNYYLTYLALMGLLIVTVGLYYIDLQRLPIIGAIHGINLMVALVIAVIKAALVVLIFMNVKGSTKLTWLWAALGFIWLLILAGVFIDYQTRYLITDPGWQ